MNGRAGWQTNSYEDDRILLIPSEKFVSFTIKSSVKASTASKPTPPVGKILSKRNLRPKKKRWSL